MNCAEAQKLLDAHIDGELDLLHDLEVEEHISTCPSCAAALHNLKELRAALANPALLFEAPPGLAEQLARQSAREAGPAPLPNRPAFRLPSLRLPLGSFGLGTAFACLLMMLWTVARPTPTPTNDLASAVLASHVRALMVGHLMDVPSTDKHTVKPWFNGKLDFSPPVQDFVKSGFPLIGGRMDYLDNRPVAALVYRRRRHFINLFVWPADHAANSTPSAPDTQQGYHLLHWQQNDTNFWAISDLGVDELEEFVQLVQKSGNDREPS